MSAIFGLKQTPLENLEPILREDIQKVFLLVDYLSCVVPDVSLYF
jgi:hypothetical protein